MLAQQPKAALLDEGALCCRAFGSRNLTITVHGACRDSQAMHVSQEATHKCFVHQHHAASTVGNGVSSA
jgi:hypothetical protein